MIDNRNVGKTITALRQARGLSQQGLATLCTVTHQAVSKWENGIALPDMQTLLFLSKLFQVSMEDILTGQASPEPAETKADEKEQTALMAQEAESEPVCEAEPEQTTQQEEEVPAPAQVGEPWDTAPMGEKEDNQIPDMDWAEIISLAPFASTKMLDQLVEKQLAQGTKGTLSWSRISGLLPFLSEKTAERLFSRFSNQKTDWAEVDTSVLVNLAPFVSQDFLRNAVIQMGDRIDAARALKTLVPFLPSDVVDELIRKRMKQGQENASAGKAEGAAAVREADSTLDKDNSGKESGAQEKPRDKAGKERLMMRIARKAVEDGNEEWLEENMDELSREEAAMIGALAAEKGMWDIVTELWEQADADTRKRALDDAIQQGKWDLLEEFSEEADEATARCIAQAAIQAQKWDFLEELSEGIDDDDTLRMIAQAAISAQKWDFLEELSESVDNNDTLRMILEAAIEHSQWDLITTISERL